MLTVPTPSTVGLTERQVRDAESLAGSRHRALPLGAGHYGVDTIRSQLTGALGEVAAHEWLRLRAGRVTGHFKFKSQDGTRPDITADGCRIEVKTWRDHTWATYGRSLSVSQLSSILRHAEVLLFCRVPTQPAAPTTVDLMGWAPATLMLSEGVPTFRGARAQLQLPESALLPPLELLGRAGRASRREIDLTGPGTCPNGHAMFVGHCWTCLASEELRFVLVIESARARAFHRSAWSDYKRAHNASAISLPHRILPLGDVVSSRRPCLRCFPPRPSEPFDDVLLEIEES